jgi:hypothetical protein
MGARMHPGAVTGDNGMAVPLHVDRGTVLATAVQKRSSVVARSVDEFVGATEIDRLDVQWARRRQDDQVGVAAVPFDVIDQPTMGQQADGVERHREGPARSGF